MASTQPKPRKTSKGVQLRLKGLEARVAQVDKSMMRTDLPRFWPGDTLKVHVRIKEGEKERIQAFEGICIARSNKGGSKTFIVRKISHGVGVERVFAECSPKVAKIEIVQEGKVRRAKLYYLRELEGKAARVERDLDAQTSTTGSTDKSALASGSTK